VGDGVSAPSSTVDPTLVKLNNVLGPVRARALVAEILAEIGRPSLEEPADRLAFGEALVRRGGLLEAIGRAIRVQAFLLGARERTTERPTGS
jgi:hypothetical protein